MNCRHCEGDATENDPDEGDSFKCKDCGILGTVHLGDRDVSFGDYIEAVAFLYFEANDGEKCSWDGCEECREVSP